MYAPPLIPSATSLRVPGPPTFTCLPAALQRGHHNRLDNQQNVFLAGVMRSELGAFAGVKAALEESSEDGRFHGGPIESGGGAQGAHIGRCQIENCVIGKQAAVEPVNVVHAKVIPAGGHGREELAQPSGEVGGRGPVEFDQLPEKMVRQKADAVRKEAEKQAHEEMSNGFRLYPALAKTGGELGKLLRRRFRDAGGGALGAELLRIGEGVSQDFKRRERKLAVGALVSRSSSVNR